MCDNNSLAPPDQVVVVRLFAAGSAIEMHK